MYHFAALLVGGYESHDDYIETARYSVEIVRDEPWMDGVERAVVDAFLGDPNSKVEYDGGWFGWDGWVRVESIERVEED